MSIKNSPLLEEYRKELEKVWSHDPSMIDYCIKSTQNLIKLSGGQLFATDKPRIETEFYFGYSSCGQGPSYDEMNESVDECRKHKAEHFKNENLCKYDSVIKQFEEADKYTRQPYICCHYWPEYNANIVTVTWIGVCDWEYDKVLKGEYIPLPKEDIAAIVNVYKEDREAMEKRLDTYLKKYGTSKLSVHTYWIDE